MGSKWALDTLVVVTPIADIITPSDRNKQASCRSHIDYDCHRPFVWNMKREPTNCYFPENALFCTNSTQAGQVCPVRNAQINSVHSPSVHDFFLVYIPAETKYFHTIERSGSKPCFTVQCDATYILQCVQCSRTVVSTSQSVSHVLYLQIFVIKVKIIFLLVTNFGSSLSIRWNRSSLVLGRSVGSWNCMPLE